MPENRMTMRPDGFPLAANIRHQLPGRVRLGLAMPLPERTVLGARAEAIAALEGVESVEIRLSTASMLIRHQGDFEPIAARLAETGLAVILPEMPQPAFDPIRQTVHKLGSVETALRHATGGAMDLRKALFVGLVGAGLVQLARGRIAGPALTLFGQAAGLISALVPPEGGKR
jgi:hypothetical protein